MHIIAPHSKKAIQSDQLTRGEISVSYNKQARTFQNTSDGLKQLRDLISMREMRERVTHTHDNIGAGIICEGVQFSDVPTNCPDSASVGSFGQAAEKLLARI